MSGLSLVLKTSLPFKIIFIFYYFIYFIIILFIFICINNAGEIVVNWSNSFLPKISNLLLVYSWLFWAVKKATSPEADLSSMQYEGKDQFLVSQNSVSFNPH